jgi:hypothetical protein
MPSGPFTSCATRSIAGLASGIRFRELRSDEFGPHCIRLPNVAKQSERTMFGPAPANAPIQAQERRDSHVRGAMHPHAAVLVTFHGLEEFHKIAFCWSIKLHWYVNVIKPERLDGGRFICAIA